tara:strand:+ start:8304 stop:8513 length:210 start_codon:yes stop_codon:yes gene_type:complete
MKDEDELRIYKWYIQDPKKGFEYRVAMVVGGMCFRWPFKGPMELCRGGIHGSYPTEIDLREDDHWIRIV